ncbi:MAG TPA: deoxyribose-phosphate aldolase [Candidatus Krumholzibacteria bacterium]|nr:deoxyribose-phosphate aldolase [Candidatus Krumholzibacteria bacterium]
MNRRDLARIIDHTCLRPDAGAARVDATCDEAVRLGMRVCVAPRWVPRAVDRVAGRGEVIGVVGFPHGDTTLAAMQTEARGAMDAGAVEADMVIPIGALKDGDDATVRETIAGVAAIVHERPGRLLKVILETALLSPAEIVRGCRLAEAGGADFVKTSTGFSGPGASVENVRRMRAAVGDRLGVKAAGGIRDYATAMAMVAAGASRIGASASLAILDGAPPEDDDGRES